jgi:hypothetical protein
MNPTRLVATIASLLLAFGSLAPLRAAEVPAGKDVAVSTEEAVQKHIDAKAGKLLKAIQLDDAAKAARVKAIMGEWFVTMWNWHKENDPKLKELWSQWSKARAVVPKDEFPGEVIAHRIDDVYASLKPAYQSFLDKLATELTPEQIDTIKETWSRSPGMTRTYNAYLEIVPNLTEEQKKVIYDLMVPAREAAMLTDNSKEIVNIYKVHKVKVEAYVGSLEWEKLHSAYANKGKTPPATDGGGAK